MKFLQNPKPSETTILIHLHNPGLVMQQTVYLGKLFI